MAPVEEVPRLVQRPTLDSGLQLADAVRQGRHRCQYRHARRQQSGAGAGGADPGGPVWSERQLSVGRRSAGSVPAGTGVVAIQYKPYGIGLTVSPTVLSNDRIVLKVAPEASELDYANTIVLNSATIPSITTRRADTTVELGDGESFVIGGLVSRNTTSGTDKVPLLGDIPILGVLFKRQEFQQKESEPGDCGDATSCQAVGSRCECGAAAARAHRAA